MSSTMTTFPLASTSAAEVALAAEAEAEYGLLLAAEAALAAEAEAEYGLLLAAETALAPALAPALAAEAETALAPALAAEAETALAPALAPTSWQTKAADSLKANTEFRYLAAGLGEAGWLTNARAAEAAAELELNDAIEQELDDAIYAAEEKRYIAANDEYGAIDAAIAAAAAARRSP